MKKLLLVLFTAFTLFGCDKDDNLQSLPPATQTGAGTFACYVNGKPFIDSSYGYFNCFYQLVDGEYYFSISAIDTRVMPANLFIGSYKREIYENGMYNLLESSDGNTGAGGGFSFSQLNYQVSNTSINFTGKLIITKLDFLNNIVSGTFWFDLQHPLTGETIQIREGRFDTIFTQ